MCDFEEGYILVVDDNALNLAMISRFLDKWKVRYLTASNGKEALELMAREPFDLVLMDLYMPLINGIEAARLAKQKQYAMPIIALSAQPFSEDLELEERLLFADYLVKPFQPTQLLEVIQSHFPKYSKH